MVQEIYMYFTHLIKLYWEYGEIFSIFQNIGIIMFLPYFQHTDKTLLVDLCIFTGYERVGVMIQVARSSLACKDTKHWTQNSERFLSPSS